MEDFISGLVSQLDRGEIDRRQFCQTVALAAVVYAAGEEAANAAPAQGFTPIAINHISYACADYRKARDFYSSLLGMVPAPNADNGRETRLMFGPPPGHGGTFLIPRNGSIVPRAKAIIDHICYTISDWNEADVVAVLKARGLQPTGRPGSLHVYDPFDYDVQIANAAEETRFATEREIPMEAYVAQKVDDYRAGRITRRQLIETLTAAATTASSAGAKAATEPGLKAALVNHISYTCPDFKQAADWYSKIFNLDQVGETKNQVVLPFGKKGEKPFGVTANDVPLTHLIIRTRDPNAAPRNAGPPRPQPKALINHIAYTIADWDQNRVRAELARLGYRNPEVDTPNSFHIVDVNGFDVQISGIEMNALNVGG